MRKNGFTLIELLAVIVILAIILAIAIPGISSVIQLSKKGSFESNAKMIFRAINYEKLKNLDFDPTIITKDNMYDKLNLNADNYYYIKFEKVDNDLNIIVIGAGKWEGLTAYGTIRNITVVNTNEYEGIKPVVNILGANPIRASLNRKYKDPGATAMDLVFGDLSVSVSSNIDTSVMGTYYVTYTATNQLGQVSIAKREVIVSDVIVAESIIDGIANNDLVDGDYQFEVNGENYSIELLNVIGDKTYALADGNTISLGNMTSDQRMLVVKYTGDLTIESGVTLTAAARKKGMLLYVSGTLNNSGTISMTARGAIAEGQDVYLWKNTNDIYEYVPAIGGAGAAKVTSGGSGKGKKGIDGVNRSTGGGGSGGVYLGTSGAGAVGTSYSGGSGGGAGGQGDSEAGFSGVINGGAGGRAGRNSSTGKSGGGAGNPGGAGYTGYSLTPGFVGGTGTGGLLIIYSDSLINNGSITSNGVNGGGDYRCAGGGGSGGGSINIFYKNQIIPGTITAAGGAGGGGTSEPGGAGGTGSVTTTQINY